MTLNTDQKQVDLLLESLQPFDTVCLRTQNSDYRILVLDPKTGRALVEGGNLLVEPKEALLCGSRLPGSTFKFGAIAMGHRLEMWVEEMMLSTSNIESISLTPHDAAALMSVKPVTVH